MVKERLKLETEVQDIFNLIDDEKNFLLSGGAGSGKTYSLVSVIRQVIEENPSVQVACMTYTNAAVKEIEERVNHKNLNVSTIHDFLWDNIKHFQKELKKALVSLANDIEVSKISIKDINPVPENYFDNLDDGIQYKEFLRMRDGIISHDELLILANYLFSSHPKLSSIVKDKYKFIFIDEYQDTNKYVVEIFLNHFKKSSKKNIIGFFGDAMQAIYPEGIGSLAAYKEDDLIDEIKKEQNRRNPQKVIDLANKLRTDGINQIPSSDLKAPNMDSGVVKQGTVLFLHSNTDNVESVREYLVKNHDWDFKEAKETKELNLTHNLIADKAGFENLMSVYDKDLVLKFRDRIRDYIKKHDIDLDFSESTFGEVIEILQNGKTGRDLKAVSPTKGMKDFIANNTELYNYAKTLNYLELSKVYFTKDQLLDDKKQDEEDKSKKGAKRDSLIKHLFKIQQNISLYQNKKYNEFLKVTDFRFQITSIKSKRVLKENIEHLIDVGEKTIDEVINDANIKGICLIDDKLKDFQEKNVYLYNRVKNIKFSEFQKLFEYLEGKTPFSTQHKTKGAEFDNVLVILDNGKWNNYNFENLFLEAGSPTVLDRSQKIFYVCCTRAKENLAVFFNNPSQEVISKAKEWFGVENVVNI
ncbi:UvrD-helicase domain-containing protein [Brumimicrobium oceani]|uniref:ATP-dependent helicase n=1 Tax=Brumimicrobium oceani TaxID=2100725 RepID=A0A2U2XG27_9FLAO|nr:UvrD-helicase domain-containing protein [Brumimicrobium oceani]PWH86752.1 ATP-dependent helicase [Brumimicrobium oceani]